MWLFFEGKNTRRHWDGEKKLWYFSVVDVVAVLTGTCVPRRYWSDLKIKLKGEGSEVYEKIVQLKLLAWDARKEIKKKTGKNVISEKNVKELSILIEEEKSKGE